MSTGNDPYIDANLSQFLLETALDPPAHSLCRKPEASHACSAAAAGLAAKGMDALLQHVRDVMDARAGELDDESVFSVEKVEEHLIGTRNVLGCLYGLAGHLAADCYRLLPGAGEVYEKIITTRDFLSESAVSLMDQFLRELPDAEERSAKVRRLLKVQVLTAFAIALGHPAMLLSANRQAHRIVGRVRSDWDADVSSIKTDPRC